MHCRTPFPPAPSAMSPGSNHRLAELLLRRLLAPQLDAAAQRRGHQDAGGHQEEVAPGALRDVQPVDVVVLRRVHRRPGRARPHLPGDLQIAHEAGHHQPQRVPQPPPGARARSRAPALATDRARAPPAPRLARARDRARVRARRRRLRGSRSGLRRARGQGAAHGMIARGRLIRGHRDRER